MTKRYSWTQPACDRCWNDREPLRVPVRFREEARQLELCVYCGARTLSGIYVRVDPAQAPHPSLTK